MSPREILLQRHRDADGKLDAIRQSVIQERERRPPLITRVVRELLLPLRWHLAGMTSVWLVVAGLNADDTSSQAIGEGGPGSSPRQLLVALTENRQRLAELIEPGAASAPQTFTPRRRTHAQPVLVEV